MGKSKDASYVDKSNFKLFKEKFKEKKRVNQKIKNDINGRNCESEKKKKKRFWSKLLTSVRLSWSCGEAQPPQVKSQLVAKETLHETMDLFEMSVDPEMQPSKIFIEPNKTESKVVITELCGSSSCLEELFPKERPVLRNVSQETRSSRKEKMKMNHDPLTTHNKSMIKNMKPDNDVKEPSEKIEPLLTSALFIRKDIDRMVESSVFMKPNLPRNYAEYESKTSDELSQKSLRINNVRVSYKDQDKEQIIKTFKTTSEPTWEERRKIIHRQRLNENINYLVKQFVFLEAQDVIGLSGLKNDSVTGKKDIRLNHSSGSTGRDLSREVSPEILVNIKPFKEYLNENLEDNQKTPKTPRLSEKQAFMPRSRPVRVPEYVDCAGKRANAPQKPTVTFSKKNVHDKENSVEAKAVKHHQSILTLSPVKNEANTWSEDASDDLGLESQSFSFWDMYKTYSKCKNLVQVEVELESSSFPLKPKRKEEIIQGDLEAEEDILRSSTSLDEVIDNLEDGDHDLIFQKNLSQFKKKISVMPRLDFRKPTFNTNKRGPAKMEDKVWQKLVRVENPLESENHNVQKVARIADFSLGNSMEKKIEICRSKCLDLRSGLLWKSEKILENIYLMCCESTVINQILATRVEAKMFSLRQTLREIHDMQENNMIAVVEVENPKNFNETVKKVELLCVAPMFLQKSYVVEPKQSEAIAIFLYSEKIDLQKDLGSISNEILKTGDSFEASERHPDSPATCHTFELHLNTFEFKEALSSSFLEFSKEATTEEEDENKPKAVESSLRKKRLQTLTQVEVANETSRRVVLMLNEPSYDYTAHIYEKKLGFLKLCCKFYSESNIFRTSVYERRHQSDSAFASTKRKTASSKAQEVSSGNSRSNKSPDFSPDHFHVSCCSSGENLKKDEGEIKTSSWYSLKKQVSLFNAGNTEANKEIKKEEEEKLQKSMERLFEYKSNFSTEQATNLENRRVKRTWVSLKEIETPLSDFVHCSKKRASADEAEETMNEETSVREKPHFDKSLALPRQLIVKQEGEADKRITFQLRKSGANLKKELVAAINFIKDLNSFKGEAKGSTKQISLIILFSKN